jgi:PadR family transcriptional regulator, regulatory protein PadR
MNLLTRSEEVYLLAILQLKDDAYGVPIKKFVSKKLNKIISYGGLYFALDQLVKKGLVNKTAGEPTAKRGGRTKFYYTLTNEGKQALKTTFEHHKLLWDDISDLAFD